MLYFENYIIKNKFYFIIYFKSIFSFFQIFLFFRILNSFKLFNIKKLSFGYSIYPFIFMSKFMSKIFKFNFFKINGRFLVIACDSLLWFNSFVSQVNNDHILLNLYIILFKDRLLNINYFMPFFENLNFSFIVISIFDRIFLVYLNYFYYVFVGLLMFLYN